MKQKRIRRSGYLALALCSTFLAGVFSIRLVHAFTEPSGVPFDYPPSELLSTGGSNLAPPLNTSAVPQVKRGKLTVQGDTTLNAAAPDGVAAAQRFCIGTDCITNWPQFPGPYVDLQTTTTPPPILIPNNGFASLDAQITQTAAFTAEGGRLVGRCSNNTDLVCAVDVDCVAPGVCQNYQANGAVGQSAANVTAGALGTAGVLGIAGNGGNTMTHYGIYGTTFGVASVSYSGYFKGRTRASGMTLVGPVPQSITNYDKASFNIDSDGTRGLTLSSGNNVLRIAAQASSSPTCPTGVCYDIDAETNPLQLQVDATSTISVKDALRVDPDRARDCTIPYLGNPGEQTNAAGIILNRNCRNTWPTSGTSAFWSQDGSSIYPNPSQGIGDEDLMLGSTMPANAPFRVDVTNGDNAVVLVKGSVAGWGKTEGLQMVIGEPDLGYALACGDGICNAGENATCADCT